MSPFTFSIIRSHSIIHPSRVWSSKCGLERLFFRRRRWRRNCCDIVAMANRPSFAGWPPGPQQQHPGFPHEKNGADFRPFLQHPPRFPPPGHVPHGNVYPPPRPGSYENSQGWSSSPYPRGYPHPGPLIPPGNRFSVAPDVPVKPLFLNWMEENAKEVASSNRLLRSSDIYKLVDTVEATIAKILALTDLQSASAVEFAVCPFNSRHVLPVEALFRHTLQCPVEASSLLNSLQYPLTVNDTAENEKISESGMWTLSTSKQQFDPRGSLFFYKEAPGVVLISSAHFASGGSGDLRSSMPPSLRTEIGNCSKEPSSIRLLPSMLWRLEKELDTWKDMPSQCSRTVLELATCLGRVRRTFISNWLLLHSPVPLDVAMAAHISCLVQLFLRALRTQSLTLLDESKTVECPMYTEASTWLASWLIHLYGPVNSKAVVLGVLKHCLKACGRFLSDLPKPEDLKVFHLVPDSACIDNSNVEEILEVKQAGSAMDALYERANFERYMKSLLVDDNLTRFQRNDNYDKMVHFAFNERAKRPSYRAVIEHDGLTWQPSQQEEKRNKTKAELLAEERDYKRRRMSYRGKKLKRTPLQVLHDIIENHMTQIIAAGGIGSFSKQPLPDPSVSLTEFESQQQGQGSILTTPSFHPHFESAYRSRTIDTDMAANMPRLYDDHRDASSVSRNDFRSRSRSRYDNERHYDSRR